MKPRQQQAGVVLAVTLFMLALLTIIGISAVMLSTTHFRLVGNLQTTIEAEMALRSAIEQVVCEKVDGECRKMTYFCKTINFCVNGRTVPVQIRSSCNGAAFSNSEGGSLSATNILDTYWDMEGKVVDAMFGANTAVHWGLRVPQGGTCPGAPNPLPPCEALGAIACN